MLKPLPKQVLKPQLAKDTRINPLTQTSGRTVFLGENTYWNLDKVSNPHMVILGTSGSGKTRTLATCKSRSITAPMLVVLTRQSSALKWRRLSSIRCFLSPKSISMLGN